jgi:hypothetical protein
MGSLCRKGANLLTDELVAIPISRWAAYENEAIRYVDSVLGIKTPTTVNLLAIVASGITEKDIKSDTFGSPSDTDSSALKKFYELDSDPQLQALLHPSTKEEQIKQFLAVYASASDAMLYNALRAPTLRLGTNRRTLNNSAASYRQAADIMQ